MMKQIFLIALCAITLSACATPREVRQAAGQTAANIGLLQSALGRLTAGEKQVADQRAANIARLRAETVRVQRDYEIDLALMDVTNAKASEKLLAALKAWRDKLAAIDAKAMTDEEELKQEILTGQVQMDTRKAQLGGTAKILGELSKKDSIADLAKFLTDFAESVSDEVKALETKGAAASKSAVEDSATMMMKEETAKRTEDGN